MTNDDTVSHPRRGQRETVKPSEPKISPGYHLDGKHYATREDALKDLKEAEDSIGDDRWITEEDAL